MEDMTWEEVEIYGPDKLELTEGQEKTFVRAFRELSEIGRRLDAEGLITGENLDKIREAADTTDDPISFEEYVAAAKRLYLLGDLQRKRPVAEEPKKLTPSQQAWSEHRQWSESHTSSECKARARVDESYGSFYRKNFEREFAAEQVGDAVVPAGQPTAKVVQANDALVEFVRRYHATPSSQLKPKGGFVVVGGVTMAYSDFRSQLDRAINARLV